MYVLTHQVLVDKPWINDTTCFIVDLVDPDVVGEEYMIPFDNMSRSVTVSEYTKQNNELDTESDLTQFLLSVSHKDNLGVHIDRYNTSVLYIKYSTSLDIII